MMENGLIWFLGLAVISLTQALVLVLKFSQRRAEKKSVPEIDSDNPGEGERIGIVETEVKNIKESNEKDHRLMRRDIRKLFGLLNGMRK